ncbi:hypothetical protein DFQ29_001877 [Apophysomyces sp. BC1021]|nr:hypothetical protein DFQ29_001877 [Apophysomyces sp. BC1021]
MSQIPVELLNIVASFLLSKELHTCSCVCRYWFSIFRVAIQRAKVFIKTSEQLHSFVLRHDPQLFPPGQLIRELRLRRTFNLQPGDLEQIQRHYPMVEVFEVGQDYGTIGHPDYYRLFQWWPHLRRTPQISKYSDDLDDGTDTRCVRPTEPATNMRTSELKVTPDSPTWLNYIAQKYPCLETLDLCLGMADVRVYLDEAVYEQVLVTIASNLNKLQHFELDTSFWFTPRLFKTIKRAGTRFTYFGMSVVDLDEQSTNPTSPCWRLPLSTLHR